MKKLVKNIVQFFHPGTEHTYTKWEKTNNFKLWNNGPHHRKFLKAKGCVVNNAEIVEADVPLYFWGEWEPDSFIAKLTCVGRFLHKYRHVPVLIMNRRGMQKQPSKNPASSCYPVATNCQNTDPFVFGDYFLYSCCQQQTKKWHQTQMCVLECGSLILFGSSCNSQDKSKAGFMLDTVFVVSDRRDYKVASYYTDLAGFVPNDYYYIMGFKYWNVKNDEFVCYKGATIHNQVDGMYSFVPCRTGEEAANGFERPVLRDRDFASIGAKIIADRMTQSFRIVPINGFTIKNVWDGLVSLLDKRGYRQGVMIEYDRFNTYSSLKSSISKKVFVP